MMTKNDLTKKYENPFLDFFYQELHMINSLCLKVIKPHLYLFNYFMRVNKLFDLQNVCVEVPRLLNIVYEERFPMKWLNNFSMIKMENNKYDLSLISVSSFIEKNTTSGLCVICII